MGNHVSEQFAVERTEAEAAEKRGNRSKQERLRCALGNRPALVSSAVAMIVFAADANTPLGVASAVPYSLAVLMALKARSPQFVYWLASLCSILTMIDLAIGPGPGGTEMWKVLTNRFLALFMIWVTTVLGVRRRSAENRRRQAEEQTRLYLAKLAHMGRLELAGQLATGLAHQLNQPLAAVSLQAEVAIQLAQDANASREALRIALCEITEQSQRAAAIVRSLRQLVQKTQPQRSPVDLNQVVRAVMHVFDPLARRAGIDIQLRLDDTPLVRGDKVQLEQVMINLLHNALEANRADDADLQQVHVQTSHDNQHVTVIVRDTGVGLRPEQYGHLFEPFYSTKPTGMGMGLFISRSIIEGHGGRLWAEPHARQGATFLFTLPAPSRT